MTDAATPEPATAPESPADSSRALDLPAAARKIERLLDAEETASGPTDRRRRRRPTAPETGRPIERKDEAGDDTDLAAEADPSAATEPEEEEGEQPRYTVKIDGEEQEVTLAELLKGYQRGADYTRKTMRLGEERRELRQARERAEQEIASAQAERQRYAHELDVFIPYLRQQMQAQFAGIDWARLAAEDPVRFNQLKPIHDTLAAQLGQAEAAQMALREQERQRLIELQRADQRHLAEERRALAERLPEFADPVKGPREKAALRAYLLESGYRDEELARPVDHRDVILARKAMLYDRMMASKDKVAQRVAALPRVQTPGAGAGRGDRATARRAALMKRLKSTGRTEDAARLIEDML